MLIARARLFLGFPWLQYLYQGMKLHVLASRILEIIGLRARHRQFQQQPATETASPSGLQILLLFPPPLLLPLLLAQITLRQSNLPLQILSMDVVLSQFPAMAFFRLKMMLAMEEIPVVFQLCFALQIEQDSPPWARYQSSLQFL